MCQACHHHFGISKSAPALAHTVEGTITSDLTMYVNEAQTRVCSCLLTIHLRLVLTKLSLKALPHRNLTGRSKGVPKSWKKKRRNRNLPSTNITTIRLVGIGIDTPLRYAVSFPIWSRVGAFFVSIRLSPWLGGQPTSPQNRLRPLAPTSELQNRNRKPMSGRQYARYVRWWGANGNSALQLSPYSRESFDLLRASDPPTYSYAESTQDQAPQL